jgi:formylglycine-generating enzyme required for sulfatase activity/serine/threonine protein kinase
MLSPNSILQNRYRVVRKLGEGGMGAVYEAVDQRVSCVVALKETFAGREGEARNAFEREAALLANLRHQALPKVMDYFSENEGDFLVMEFIPGYDLAELLDLRGGPFPQSQVLRWADDLLRVLEYLHGQEPPILHRDIKPSNLKLTKQGEVFLLDFGLAKGSLGHMPTLATSRSVRGYTPIYAALEQIHGHGTDARSDIYSLGATLYHLLTGVAPIDAPTRFHAVEEDQHDPLPPVEKLNTQASSNVGAVIHQAMAISRKQRPASAAVMRQALRNAAEEDERGAAEGEYRRAESRRRELEEEKQRYAEEPAVGSGEERRLQEAETLKKEEEASRRADLPSTVHTLPGPTVAAAGHAVPPTERPISQPGIKTIPAPPPARLSMDGDDAAVGGNELTRTNTAGSKRAFVIATVVLAVAVVVAIIAWSLRGTVTHDSSASTQTQPDGAQPRTRTNQAGIEFVLIPPGTFMMGSTNGEPVEKPIHQVTINYSFYMGKYQVTQAQWNSVMGNNPSLYKGEDLPVESVSWNDAHQFIQKLNQRHDGYIYRLPTEAEWEYACRAGTRGDYAGDLDSMAWYANNSGHKTHPVGKKAPNSFGLFDMHGNVWEWCQDWNHENYNGAPADGSPWLSGGAQKYRVLRGGSEDDEGINLRSAYRYGSTPDYRNGDCGFRVVAIR